MGNVLLPVHAQDITDTALISFKNHCVMARFVDRQYDKLWGQSGAKRGTTINLRYPPQYELRRGNKAQPQGSNETYFPVTLGEPTGVDLDFTSQELLLTVDDFMGRFVKKAALPIAQGVDSDLTGLYINVPNFVGVPGTVPTAIDTYLGATTELAKAGAPIEGDEWSMVIDYKSNQKIVNTLIPTYNPNGNISKMFEDGRITNSVGYKWSSTQSIKNHTVGALGGTPLSNGVNQTGSAIICDGASNGITGWGKRGDIVQFTGVQGIKPNTVPLGGVGESTGDDKTFVLTQDVTSDGSGNITLNIYPSIITSGAFSTTNGPIPDNTAVKIFGDPSLFASKVTRQNLAFNKGAFVLGMVDLPLPGGMDMAARTTDEDTKFSIRFLRGFDINENVYISRLDILYVTAAPRPDFACRVVG